MYIIYNAYMFELLPLLGYIIKSASYYIKRMLVLKKP